jgi:hypothetical protein
MSQSVQSFPQDVIDKIGNYVYRLIDPRNGEIFYIGKGKDNRVFDHVYGTMKDRDPDSDLSYKEQRIMDIRNAGLEVLHIIHRHEIPDVIVLKGWRRIRPSGNDLSEPVGSALCTRR